jgi:hypothetical protein
MLNCAVALSGVRTNEKDVPTPAGACRLWTGQRLHRVRFVEVDMCVAVPKQRLSAVRAVGWSEQKARHPTPGQGVRRRPKLPE